MKSKESKIRSAKEVEFSADALLRSLRGHADHLEGKKRLTLRVSSLILPPPVNGSQLGAGQTETFRGGVAPAGSRKASTQNPACCLIPFDDCAGLSVYART